MEGKFLENSSDCSKGEYFCELCVLDFTSENEFEEHTWSMLHNTNLSRRKGRDCIHSCSLCKQEFVGLLTFTDHLHSEGHLESLHKWEANQRQNLSPNREKPRSPSHRQEDRPPSDWTADDFGGFVEYFSDNAREGRMEGNWRGRRSPPRHPRDIPSLLDWPQQYGYHHEEQFERRREQRDQFPERGPYSSWNRGSRDRARDFRDSPPRGPDMNYSNQENDRFHWRRNPDDWPRERHYGDREDNWYESRGLHPGDGRRPPYEREPEFRPRRENQPRRLDSRRNSNSPHRRHNQLKSGIRSVGSSRKDDVQRPSSRNSKTGCSSHKQTTKPSPNKQTEGENESKRKSSTDKTPPKTNDHCPSSGSPGGKSTRKGKPRKLARPVEEKKDEMAGADSSGTGTALGEGSERQVVRLRTNTLEVTIKGKEKGGSKGDKEKDESTCTVETSSDYSVSKREILAKAEGATKLSQETSAPSPKRDTPTTPGRLISSILKGDSSSAAKGDSLLTLEIGKGISLIPDKDNSVKVSNKQKDLLLSYKDKEVLLEQSKGNILSLPDKETPVAKDSSVANSNVQSNPSRKSKTTEETLVAFSKEHPQSSTLERSSLSTTLAAPVSISKDKNESSSTTNKSLTSSETKDKEGLPHLSTHSSSKEKRPDGILSSNGGQKFNDQADPSSKLPDMSLSQLEEREENLRSLLGIKKERKDSEEKEDTSSCAATKINKLTGESEARPSVFTNPSSVRSGSVKPAASRYIPGFSQLSLSRPQCSFVHIDGVQCGAVTWNKYCSYHQRVFKGEDNSTQDKSLTSNASQKIEDGTRESESPRRPLIGRPGGAQMFRPNTPPRDPSKQLGAESRLDVESRHKLSYLKNFGARKETRESDIDFNSTSPSKALSSTVQREAPSVNIDLSTTVRGASMNLFLRGSSPDITSDRSTSPSIGASTNTGSRVGANIGACTGASKGANVGSSAGASIDLSDTMGRPGTSALYGNIQDSDSSPGIDLSGTVPNLEGLLALHGSSAGDKLTSSKNDLGKTLLKHGRSWMHQRPLGDSESNIDLGVTGLTRGLSAGGDDGPSIDLSETVPQPGRSRMPHELAGFDLNEAQSSNVNRNAAASSVTSSLKADTVHPNLHLVKTEPGLEKETMPPFQNTEMIDLNVSTKLLGVPHSVVAPFHATMHSPKKPPKELTKSPSEFSGKSSVLSSPRSQGASSPQGSLTSRRVSTTCPSPHDQSPGSTVSLPSLSLDLSRFNLPPAVRKALADRYSGKKTTGVISSHSVDPPEGRRSQPLFSEHRTDGTFDPAAKASPFPARLRARGQRSISLDSTILRRENTEGTSRPELFERGIIFDTHQFLNRRVNNDGRQAFPSSAVSSAVPSLAVPIPSTKVLPFSVPSQNAPSHSSVPQQEESDELQSRGLIDLSSSSYLEGMAGRRSSDAPRLNVDSSRSPSRPSVHQSRRLIDLNSSMEYGAREAPTDSSEGLSVIKRKRVDSSEGSETASSFGDEKTVKRARQEDTNAGDDKAVTYRSGINVQELLSIEREELNHLQNLHAVQSRLKSVRAQIQKLCTELDSLSSEEQRITFRMGELRSMRLSILEHACYDRKGLSLPARFVSVSSKETSTSATQGCSDDSRVFAISSEAKTRDGNSESFANVQRKMGDDSVNSSQDDTSCNNVVESLSIDYSEGSMDKEPVASAEGKFDSESSVCSSEENSLNERELTQCGEQFSPVNKTTKIMPREEGLRGRQPGEKVQERPIVGSKRETVSVEVQDKISTEQCKNNSGKKAKHSQSSAKALFRKGSFSDVSVSKTIEASRKKIQSVRENMKRWKQQQDDFDAPVSKEDNVKQLRVNSRSSSADGVDVVSENPCKDKAAPSPCKSQFGDKPSPRKTTKELKKSSLFHSGKKRSKESRKNRGDKSQTRDKDCRQREGIPSKRRKVDYTSSHTHCSVPLKEKTSFKGNGQVVCAAAHTTTADLGGSGSEERASIADEIPTRDVDSQSDDASSSATFRASHLQIPSSSVEPRKKTLQNPKEVKKHRGPAARKFQGHTGAVCGLKAHNGYLFSCSADKTTKAFNVQTGECVKIFHGHHQAVNCVEISEDKERLFTGSNDQTVRSYNIKSGVCTHRFTFDGRVMCLHAAFGLLFVGLNTGIVALIDVTTNQLLDRLPCHEPRGVSCVTTATEGQRKLLCCGSFDSTVTIRDYKSGLLIRTFSDHTMTVLCLQVVDNILYSGSADMKVQAHNLNTGELLRSFDGHTRSVSGLQVAGRVLVTACLDKLIRCYDLTTGDLLQVYGGQLDMIFSVLVSNGRIFSGARDGSVVAAKLDLRVYHPCKWNNCKLNFGIAAHLKDHIKEYHVIEQGTVEACHWFQCGHQFSADDDISAVLMHVLGHVTTRTARKSAS